MDTKINDTVEKIAFHDDILIHSVHTIYWLYRWQWNATHNTSLFISLLVNTNQTSQHWIHHRRVELQQQQKAWRIIEWMKNNNFSHCRRSVCVYKRHQFDAMKCRTLNFMIIYMKDYNMNINWPFFNEVKKRVYFVCDRQVPSSVWSSHERDIAFLSYSFPVPRWEINDNAFIMQLSE